MKNLIKTALPLLLVVSFMLTVVYAKDTDNKVHNWYCVHNNECKVPTMPSEFLFIKQYDGIWLNENATEEDKVI